VEPEEILLHWPKSTTVIGAVLPAGAGPTPISLPGDAANWGYDPMPLSLM
jgi:hypothetical protein